MSESNHRHNPSGLDAQAPMDRISARERGDLVVVDHETSPHGGAEECVSTATRDLSDREQMPILLVTEQRFHPRPWSPS